MVCDMLLSFVALDSVQVWIGACFVFLLRQLASQASFSSVMTMIVNSVDTRIHGGCKWIGCALVHLRTEMTDFFFSNNNRAEPGCTHQGSRPLLRRRALLVECDEWAVVSLERFLLLDFDVHYVLDVHLALLHPAPGHQQTSKRGIARIRIDTIYAK